jgi:hypothetical protein
MYKCGICGDPSRPKEPLVRYVIPKHEDPKQIAAEVPVCRACAKQLQAGLTPADIRQTLAPPTPAPERPVVIPTTQRQSF